MVNLGAVAGAGRWGGERRSWIDGAKKADPRAKRSAGRLSPSCPPAAGDKGHTPPLGTAAAALESPVGAWRAIFLPLSPTSAQSTPPPSIRRTKGSPWVEIRSGETTGSPDPSNLFQARSRQRPVDARHVSKKKTRSRVTWLHTVHIDRRSRATEVIPSEVVEAWLPCFPSPLPSGENLRPRSRLR